MVLKVLLIKGTLQDTYLAIGLDHYIAAQGISAEDAFREFEVTFAAEVAYGILQGRVENPLEGIPEAPSKYWRMFESKEFTSRSAAPIDIKPENARVPISFNLRDVELHHAVA